MEQVVPKDFTLDVSGEFPAITSSVALPVSGTTDWMNVWGSWEQWKAQSPELPVYKGIRLYDEVDMQVYEAVVEVSVADNTTRPGLAIDSASDEVAARWFLWGPVGRYRMYDGRIFTRVQATAPGGSTLALTTTCSISSGTCDRVGLFGMVNVASAVIRIKNNGSLVQTLTPTFTFPSPHTAYYLPQWVGSHTPVEAPEYEIELYAPTNGGVIEIGLFSGAEAEELGVTKDGIGLEWEDFSRTDFNQTYGTAQFIRRGLSRRANAQIEIPERWGSWVEERLAARRAAPTIYDLNNDMTDRDFGRVFYGVGMATKRTDSGLSGLDVLDFDIRGLVEVGSELDQDLASAWFRTLTNVNINVDSLESQVSVLATKISSGVSNYLTDAYLTESDNTGSRLWDHWEKVNASDAGIANVDDYGAGLTITDEYHLLASDGSQTAYMRVVNPASNLYYYLRQETIPVVAGRWYQASAYVKVLNAKAYVAIVWEDELGAQIGSADDSNVIDGPSGSPGYSPGDDTLESFDRPWKLAQAPTGAVRATFRVVLNTAYTGSFTAVGFYVRPMFGEAVEDQESPSSWLGGMSGASVSLIASAIEDEAAARATLETTLQSQIDDKAESTIVNALDTRVTTNEGEITTLASRTTTLESEMNAVEGSAGANALAISTLDTRVTTNEGDISSQASSITTLQSEMDAVEGSAGANASAISTLDTRVTTNEGDISAISSRTTTLESEMDAVESTSAGNSSAISTLDSRVTVNEGEITSLASDVTSLEANVFAGNLCPDSLMQEPGTTFTASGASEFGDWAKEVNSSWVLETEDGSRTLYMKRNSPTSGYKMYMSGTQFPVIVGERYQASCYSRVAGGTLKIALVWVNSLGSAIARSDYTFTTTYLGSSSAQDLEDFVRIYSFGIAPAGAVSAYWRLECECNSGSESVGFAVMPMAGKATSGQTVPSPFVHSNGSPDMSARMKNESFVYATPGEVGGTYAVTITADYGSGVEEAAFALEVGKDANGDYISKFEIRADEFRIINNLSTGATDVPFEIVGGITYIKQANIPNLSADKITTGTLDAESVTISGDLLVDGTVNGVKIEDGSINRNDKLLHFGQARSGGAPDQPYVTGSFGGTPTTVNTETFSIPRAGHYLISVTQQVWCAWNSNTGDATVKNYFSMKVTGPGINYQGPSTLVNGIYMYAGPKVPYSAGTFVFQTMVTATGSGTISAQILAANEVNGAIGFDTICYAYSTSCVEL
jgi:predicted  nucleic acid-binding Zn-ribbon protein